MIICTYIGRYTPLLDIRRYVFDMSRTLTNVCGTKTTIWRSFPAEMTAIMALSSPGLKGWRSIPDPSQFLSYELVARPNRSSVKQGVPVRGVGMGNVVMYSPTLYYATLLVEVKPEESFWSIQEGAPRYQYAMTFRLHVARMEINYGNSDSEHECVWHMAPGIEENMALLKVTLHAYLP